MISVDDYYRKYAVWYLHTFSVECDTNFAVFGKRLNALLNIKSIPYTIDGVKDTYYYAPNFNFEKLKQEHKDYCNSPASNEAYAIITVC